MNNFEYFYTYISRMSVGNAEQRVAILNIVNFELDYTSLIT